MSQKEVILLLGSNLGDTKKNIENALSALEKKGCVILKKSKFVKSKPEEFVSCNFFCNIATSINTSLSPIQLLRLIKDIEVGMGRLKDSKDLGGYQDRIIDIDIILFDKVSFHSDKLIIPHRKNLYERDFSKQLIEQLVNNQKHNI